jgi:hypothetical protein
MRLKFRRNFTEIFVLYSGEQWCGRERRTAVDVPIQGPGEQRGMQYRFGAYCFDPARYELAHAGMPIPLWRTRPVRARCMSTRNTSSSQSYAAAWPAHLPWRRS